MRLVIKKIIHPLSWTLFVEQYARTKSSLQSSSHGKSIAIVARQRSSSFSSLLDHQFRWKLITRHISGQLWERSSNNWDHMEPDADNESRTSYKIERKFSQRKVSRHTKSNDLP